MKSFGKRSPAEWRQAVEKWSESSLGVREFCRQHGLEEGRFYAWRKRFGFGPRTNGVNVVVRGQSEQPAVRFLPVQIKEVPATATRVVAPQRIEIFLGNGAIVRVSGELSDDNLSKIMRLAAGAAC